MLLGPQLRVKETRTEEIEGVILERRAKRQCMFQVSDCHLERSALRKRFSKPGQLLVLLI